MAAQPETVHVRAVASYDEAAIRAALPEALFAAVDGARSVVLKPNWVMESHKTKPDDWEYVITHPAVIGAVLGRVLDRLDSGSRVVITDGPTTEASFAKLIARYPVEDWHARCRQRGVGLDVIDLRDHEWVTEQGIIVQRTRLTGDPRGKTEVNLQGENSEFWGHRKSRRGYYGADYDRSETNRAHDGRSNLYSVSRTVLEADVFINLPKLKTHRKAGITGCLKNLVGINTYKNYLPHHSEGGPADGGDQFPGDGRARVEGPFVAFMKNSVLQHAWLARRLKGLAPAAWGLFGKSSHVVRSGNWYGNDTIWRMILDLNKVLLYANPDGTLRPGDLSHRKAYIGVVDAILAGEGIGPIEPDPVALRRVVAGTNPVAIDAVCARLMGFDPELIPSIHRAGRVRCYPLLGSDLAQTLVELDGTARPIGDIGDDEVVACRPHFGWTGHIEWSAGRRAGSAV